jgi:hypothetical protein
MLARGVQFRPMNKKVSGFVVSPTGLMDFVGVTMAK